MELIQLLRELTQTPGVSGCEQPAARVAAKALTPYCDEVTMTNRGSVVGRIYGIGPLTVFDAHLDQIGLVVTDVCDDGFIKFAGCGGIDLRTLSGAEVTVLGTEPVYGILSTVPPHLSAPEDAGKAKDITDLAIDTGLSKEGAECRIRKGDRVVFRSTFAPLLGTQVTSGALDDRAGVAALIRTAQILHADRDETTNVLFQFSVQEEVGGQGASTTMTRATSDFLTAEDTEAIAVDVSFGWSPDCSHDETGELGKGPMIGYSPLLSDRIFEDLKAVAEEHSIDYQLEIMNGRTGTHADELAVSLGGVATGIVSIPLKYMHTPVEVIDTEDVEATAALLAAYTKTREARA